MANPKALEDFHAYCRDAWKREFRSPSAYYVSREESSELTKNCWQRAVSNPLGLIDSYLVDAGAKVTHLVDQQTCDSVPLKLLKEFCECCGQELPE